jgi:hypothetical protein
MGITYRDSSGNVERVEYVGAVLGTREQNLYHDSYFHAIVWDDAEGKIKSVEYGATAYYSNTGVTVDATREVIEKAVAQRAAAYLADWERSHKEDVRKGYTARVTVRGEGTLTGVVAWIGEDKPRTAWDARYGTRTPRYGIRVEGRKGLVFRNKGAKTLEVDVPAWTAEDREEMTARAEGRARHDFREALRLADEREPLPAVPAPGTIVDAQEADGDGWRLYAIGEALPADEWAQGVARAVVDETAEDYRATGIRRDGSAMPGREVTVFRALGMVARWADNEGARILHDGAGAVRIERADGARLYLVPVRPEEGEEDGQEGPGAPSATVEAQQGQEAPQEAQEGAQERHEMVSGLPMGKMACACGLDDVDALLAHWVSTGVIPVVPVVEMSGVWRITGRGAEVFAEGATEREAWADAARQGFERDYFHAITHLSMAELEALTAPQERSA